MGKKRLPGQLGIGRIDLTGHRCGRLTILRPADPEPGRFGVWVCLCDCGKLHETKSSALILAMKGVGKGCTQCPECRKQSLKIRGTRHGMCSKSDHRYAAWKGMKNRCSSKRRHYKWYGARGIRVCDEWANNFMAFYEYIGPPPTPKHTLDRYPNNKGNYEPGNVRWATQKEQVNNLAEYE